MRSGIFLFWIPLGAGGSGFVRLNGRIYEGITALLQHRAPAALYHSALEVRLPEENFIVETTWPVPNDDSESRGVVVEGPVADYRLGRFRTFRYEVRRWPGGLLPDAAEAVGGPQRLSDDPARARLLLHLTASVPALVWGRDQIGAGDMWNSNSVISWLLTRVGMPMAAIQPPTGGRAPGWEAGVCAAGLPWTRRGVLPMGNFGPAHRSREGSMAMQGSPSLSSRSLSEPKENVDMSTPITGLEDEEIRTTWKATGPPGVEDEDAKDADEDTMDEDEDARDADEDAADADEDAADADDADWADA